MKDLLEKVISFAVTTNAEFITPEHFLLGVMKQNEFKKMCEKHNIDYASMETELKEYLNSLDTLTSMDENPSLSVATSNLFHQLNEDAIEKHLVISAANIVVSIYDMEDSFAQYLLHKYITDNVVSFTELLLESYNEDITNFYQDEKKMKDFAELFKHDKKFQELQKLSPDELYERLSQSAKNLAKSLSKIATKRGNIFGQDINNDSDTDEDEDVTESEYFSCINDKLSTLPDIVGRDEEIERTIQILCRKNKNNPVHIGESGVGKTSIVYGLARRIVMGDVPEKLRNCRIYALDLGSIVAGASFHGEFERRIKEVLSILMKNASQNLIYIDDIHNIMSSGHNDGSMDAAKILKPYLEDGSLRFIGSTTYHDFNNKIAKNKSISRHFQQIEVKEPSIDETCTILETISKDYERFHHVKFDKDAIRYAVEKSALLIVDRFLPDKAIDIIDEAGAYREIHPLLNKDGKRKQAHYQKVDKALINDILAKVCKINAKALTGEDNSALEHLAENISRNIYGQDNAITQVVRAVQMAKAGLTDANKPLASLLFVGPTGVGKTEVCKVLAQELGIDLIRFDMSEYTEKHTVAKLIGSPAGYVGYEDGGLLTDAIRNKPNCVLLLDEIEKAHSDIYNILLQVMDYAKLTDNRGNKADFKNVILIMTSNAGAQYAAQASIGFGGGTTKGEAMLNTIKKMFKPEFINRLSGTVVFNDMDKHMASLILDKKLSELSVKLKQKNVTLELSPEAKALLLEKGFTTQYGAREMDRVINNMLTPILMEHILFGKLKKGGCAHVVAKDGELGIKG